MNLQKLLIHELDKKAQSTGATLICSTRCLDAGEEKPQRLNTKLAEAFTAQKSKVDYAVFQPEQEFPKSFATYVNTEQNDEDFVRFSTDVVTRLKDQIANVPLAKGGYLVFSEYTSVGQRFVAVFLVRDATGEVFTHEKEFLGIGEVTYADTSRLAMACRINLATFKTGEGKPLLIINKRSKEVSEYFSRWLGASDKESSEEYTNTLYKLISKLPTPIKPDSPTQERLTIDEVRQKVHDLVKVEPSGIVNVNTLSQTVYGDETLISKYIHENHIELPTEFKTYGRSMKKFVQIRVSRDGILLQFSKGDKRKISISESGDSIIINSQAVVDSVREQLDEQES